MIVKLLCFILSNIGIWELLRRKTGVDVSFLPSLSVAIQVCCLIIGGILHILLPTAAALVIIGILCLVYFGIKDRSPGFLKNYLNASYAFLAVTMLVMLVYTRDKIFSGYDDFSHWALVVKRMLTADRLPAAEDSFIMFKTYPLGSSLYIYFFSRFVCHDEGYWMLGQIYMIAVSVMPVFCWCRKNKLACLATVFSFANFLLVYNTLVTNLLVDTLLPLAGAAAVFFVCTYCSSEADNSFCLPLCAAAYLAWVINIKNSGILFLVFTAVWLIYLERKDHKHRIQRLLVVLLPLALMLLWRIHCKLEFVGSDYSKHSMSLRWFYGVFREKSLAQMLDTCKAVIVFSVTYKDVWFTFGFMLAVGLLAYAFCRQHLSLWKKLMLLSLVGYVVYQIGELGMYLFSMPQGEASRLAGNTRYTRTVLMVIVYIGLLMLIKILSELEGKKLIPAAAAAVILPVLLTYLTLGYVRCSIKYRDDTADRRWADSVKAEYNIPEGKSYCFIIGTDDGGYTDFLERFVFQSINVSSVVVENASDMDVIGAEYIIIRDMDNPVVNEWVMNNYPQQSGEKVIIR